jgi:CMP-N-acetylneuraminic acid synthetase
MNLHDFIIHDHETLKSAMQRMTANRRGILMVCDSDNHLVGVLSDGDLRRALVDDALLVAPVANVMNIDPIVARSDEEALELLKERSVVLVPVTDSAGKVQRAAVSHPEGARVISETSTSEKRTGPAKVGVRVVAVIPARGGSKRLPRKNLAMVAGRSLLEWAIRAAQSSQLIGHIIVSTDDAEIADAARACGVEVPWLRPDDLARDDTPSISVLQHAARWAIENVEPGPEVIVLLEPTAPLRTREHIDGAIKLLAVSGADSVVSVSELPHTLNPEELLTLEDGELRPYVDDATLDTRRLRGKQLPVYVQNGLVYATRIDTLLDGSLYGKRCLPFVTDWNTFVDIDTQDDLALAEVRMRESAHWGLTRD